MKKNELLNILEQRYKDNMHRHQSLTWEMILPLLNDSKLEVIYKMENTGGSPDVVSLGDELYFVDFTLESPIGRRSLCYDIEALNKRKANKPQGDAITMASDIGITILNEQEYYYIQQLENLDLKSSSWILTEANFRKLGGAKFCEKRYNETFTFHNGADSYYAARGFRGKLKIK